MLGAVFAFIVMAMVARRLSQEFSVAQILFFRVGPALPILVAMVWLTKGRAGFAGFRTYDFKLHVARNCCQLMGQSAWVYALATLPFALVFAIEYSTPLWSVLITSLLLREHPNRWQKLGLLIGFLGILIIVRPGPEGIAWSALIMVGGCVAFGTNNTISRLLRRRDPPLTNPFWTCVLQIPITLIAALVIGWAPVGWEDVPAILVISCAMLLAHYSMATALSLAPIARVVPLDYLRLPIIAVIGVIFYAEAVDPLVIAGAVVVIGAVLLTQKRSSPSS